MDFLLKDGFVEVDDGVKIHYVEAGSGAPIVFIPGWTMTAAFFRNQIPFFAEKGYRAIAYDPRGQGISSAPLAGHTFKNRGSDLKTLMKALSVEAAVVVGWSYGCYDCYSYLRANGTAHVNAYVAIDEPPVSFSVDPGTWHEVSPDDIASTVRSFLDRREDWIRGYAAYMIGSEDARTIQWIVDQTLMTSDTVASAILLDGMMSDFSDVAKAIDGRIPTLTFARQDWAASAKAWIKSNTPKTELIEMPVHMAFWTEPEVFNNALVGFVSRNLAR